MLEKLFITNSVNLATRVRISILKAIAKKISNTDNIIIVFGFIPRPVMHIKSKRKEKIVNKKMFNHRDLKVTYCHFDHEQQKDHFKAN